MHDLCERARRRLRKIRFDADHRIFRGQHAAARHSAQSFARLQLWGRLLQRATTGDQKKGSDRAGGGDESGDDECKAMFAKSCHSDLALIFGANDYGAAIF